jgi:hypothetical protein
VNIAELKQIAESCFKNPTEDNRVDKEVAELVLKLLAVVDAASKVVTDYADPYELSNLCSALKELES